MQHYTFAELHGNIARENKSVGVSVHLQTEKKQFSYLHKTFLNSYKYVQIKCNCNFKKKKNFFRKFKLIRKLLQRFNESHKHFNIDLSRL